MTDLPHVITTIKQHPMVGEYWQAHCSCGGGVTMLYRTPEDAEQAARDHQPGQRASDWDRAEEQKVQDDFAFPKVPVELRPLFIAVSNVLTEELRQPGERADLVEATLRNRIRHAFEGRQP